MSGPILKPSQDDVHAAGGDAREGEGGDGITAIKVVAITPIPTPYRDPFWEEFGSRSDVDLTVIYCSQGKADRPWSSGSNSFGYRRIFPAGRNILARFGWGASCYWNSEVSELLKEIRPDAVLVGGYNHLTMLAGVRFCNRNHVPWFLMSESWKQRSGIKGKVKRSVLTRWLRKAGGMLPTGTRASANASLLGITEERQFRLPNVPDIEGLRHQAVKVQDATAEAKVELGIPAGKRLLLFAARMVPIKRPQFIVEGFSKLKNTNTMLVMIGDGPLRSEVETLAKELGCDDRVVFPGFLQPSEVHQWMIAADLFLQPSRETWGVAPIEALACGTPVLLSEQIGCADDVIVDPKVGRILRVLESDALAAEVDSMLECSQGSREVHEAFAGWATANTYSSLSTGLFDFLQRMLLSTR